MKGFIKDYRKELQSDIWLMPPLYHRVWQYLKYKVNHKENRIPMKDGTFLNVQPGQHLTSIRNIAKGVGYYEQMKWKEPNPKTISKILEWLEKQSMISVSRGKGNRQYTLITLSNWDDYQVKQLKGNSEGTPHGEGGEHPVDINKNDLEGFNNDLKDSTTTVENDAIVFYQNNIGMIRPAIAEEMIDWINDLGDELVIEALNRSIARNKPNWGYAKSILKSWHEKGIKTIEQAKAEEIEFQNQQQSRFRPNKPAEVVPDWFEKRKQAEDQPQQNKDPEQLQKEKEEIDALIQLYAEG